MENQNKLYEFYDYDPSAINSVTFSPDGSLLAISALTTTTFNLKTKKYIYKLTGHSKFINSIRFSPDGKFLASGSKDCTLKVWDLEEQKELFI